MLHTDSLLLCRLLATEILQSEEKMISSRLALNLMDQVGLLGTGQVLDRIGSVQVQAALCIWRLLKVNGGKHFL